MSIIKPTRHAPMSSRNPFYPSSQRSAMLQRALRVKMMEKQAVASLVVMSKGVFRPPRHHCRCYGSYRRLPLCVDRLGTRSCRHEACKHSFRPASLYNETKQAAPRSSTPDQASIANLVGLPWHLGKRGRPRTKKDGQRGAPESQAGGSSTYIPRTN